MNQAQPLVEEVRLTKHPLESWYKRAEELKVWLNTAKVKVREKALASFKGIEVDEEHLTTLQLLNEMGIQTEYSCAGVSLRDEPVDHSLYAYLTLIDSTEAARFVQFIREKMRHRIVITYEPKKLRFDLSSFYIKHNRSFCFLLQAYTLEYQETLYG